MLGRQMTVGVRMGPSGPASLASDLSVLPPVVRILVQKLIDEPLPGARMAGRDRLADYVRRESQGPMTISQANALNRVLEQLGVDPVLVPESAAVGSLAQMVDEHLSVSIEWTGSRYVPISPERFAARRAAVDEVLANIKNLGVDFGSLSPEEKVDARNILAMALASRA